MTTIVYAPQAEVHILSRKTGEVIDVSDDVVSGSVTRVVKAVSSAQFELLNQSRKYDGMFSPMDRVVIYLTRLRRMLVFSGYLDGVPKYTSVPGNVSIRASCTMKRLQNFLWDPTTSAAHALFNDPSVTAQSQIQDGGMAKRTIQLLNTVVGWPKDQIHIAAVPDGWFSLVSDLADKVIQEAEAAALALEVGSGSFLGGESPSYRDLSIDPTGIGPGTGHLPAYAGRGSWFGGPNGGAYGSMALTGESGTHPRDQWYCAMRWPYLKMQNGEINLAPGVGPEDARRAKEWWKNRKVLVVNPRNHRAVCLRAADWGPASDLGRVIDMSRHALENVLKATTDTYFHIAFADPSTPLGPVSTQPSALGNILTQANIQPIKRNDWGAPGQSQDMVTVTAGGCRFTINRLAKTRFTGFVNDLVNELNYHPRSIGGYSNRNIAGTNTKSNHAWGAAIDIDPDRNPRYGTAAGGRYALPHPPAIIALARKWGLGWGGEYKNSKDYMHFEVIGAPSSPDYKGSPKEFLEQGSVVVSKWVPPFPKGQYRVTTRYGEKGSHWASGYHTGTDFVYTGGGTAWITPVGPGTVDRVDIGDGSYGNAVGIDHGKGVFTYYAHMKNTPLVDVGDSVTTSTHLGIMGETGNAFGEHTHVELRLDADAYDNNANIEPYVLGGPDRKDPPRGVAGTSIDGSSAHGGSDNQDIGASLFNVWQWIQESDYSGLLLSGIRGLMNDTPIMSTVEEYMGAGLRDFCSAPNGDFIAWFPDYFGKWNQIGKMIVQPIEIDAMNPPSIGWDDETLKTHWFVTSATTGIQGADDSSQLIAQLRTAGIASVEFPELMSTLFKIDEEDFDAQEFLSVFGARVSWDTMSNISGRRQEFFFACQRFMENWSKQYSASVKLTFIPELFPGMMLCLPVMGIQGYVNQVTHSWSMADESGFSTDVQCAPWSTIGKKGPKGLPKGAPL